MIRAIVFDLYGTLLRIPRPLVPRELPRLLGLDPRRWMQLVRKRLMTTSVTDASAFLGLVRLETGGSWSPETEAAALEMLNTEVSSVELMDGVHATLGFLKRRGYRLGLVSNLTSLHKAPISRLGLDEHFSEMALSCDVGAVKPEPRIYLDLCARLGVEPQEVLVVGDSLHNDVLAPRRLEMRSLLLGSGRDASLRQVSELGWLELENGKESFVPAGAAVRLGGQPGTLWSLRPVPGAVHGRLNLVATAQLAGEDQQEEVFCKRYLFPEAAHVEEFMHGLLGRLGFSHCRTAVHAGPEPVLIVSRAPGDKFAGPVDPALAHEVGRHCAVSYLFANADWRPRNAFVAFRDGRPFLTVIDLEHCLFNLALDVTGLPHPERPETIDGLGRAEVELRLKRKVLSERTTRRAMGTFLEIDGFESEVALSFRRGWVSAYRDIAARADEVCGWIEQRLSREPFLVIGTAAYRRAMARLDVDDIRTRLRQDPEWLFPRLAAVRSRDSVGVRAPLDGWSAPERAARRGESG